MLYLPLLTLFKANSILLTVFKAGSSDLPIYALVGFVIGIFLFYQGFKWMRQKQLIESTPTSKIRSLAMGLVEIFGNVIPSEGKILKSPFSNSDCVYYRYTVEEYKNHGKRSQWDTIMTGDGRELFFLKDDTGMVLVDSNGAEIDIPQDNQYQTGGLFGKPVPKTIESFLKTKNASATGFLGIGRQLRFTEWFIAPKDKLYILGTAADNPFVKTSSRNEENIIIKKGSNESTYFISDKSEAQVLSGFKWKVWGGLLGGSALILICLLALLWFFKVL
ncbi:hypothetical protein HY993_05040 [Candidatus Micrarchaeota archaeon]|nr:hypothetical protein [Candidatus Micrarchaeota archaeon]